MTVAPAGDGVDVDISVDAAWLEGKRFPIVLDPTLVFSRANGTLVAGLNAYAPGSCGSSCGTNTTSADLTAGTYATSSGTTTARSFFRFDLAAIPPAAISSATLGLHTVACLGPSYYRCGSNNYSVELHRLSGSWSSSSTWTQLSAITDPAAFSAASVPAFYVYSGCFGCFWTYFDVAAQVQRWVDGTQANHGFAAKLAYEGPDVGGPAWSYLGPYGNTYGNLPYLEVAYTPRPGPPLNVRATADNELVIVNWDPPAPNGGPAPTSYTATLYNASTGAAVAQQSCSCTGLDFTRLVNGQSYYAKVYATNSAGNGPAATSGSVQPVACATTTGLFGDANPAQLAVTCQSPLGVNCATGNLWWSDPNLELRVPGRGVALAFVPGYNSLADERAGPLGNGWTHSYNMTLEFDSGGATVYQENASSVRFSPDGAGGYRATSNVLATLAKNPDGSFSFFRKQDLQRFVFSAAGKLSSVTDHNGYTTTLGYSGAVLASVTDPAGRLLSFTHDASSKLTRVTDPAGRSMSFTYGAGGDLATISDVGGGLWSFGFDNGHHPVSITDPNGGVLRTTFDGYCRVTSQDDNGRLTRYAYGPGSITITDPRGNLSVAQHSLSRMTSLVEASGSTEAATSTYAYDPATMGVVSATDPNGRTSTATWDASGNQLSATNALNQRDTYTYTADNRVRTATDPLGVTTTNVYDSRSNLVSSSRPVVAGGAVATTRVRLRPGPSR